MRRPSAITTDISTDDIYGEWSDPVVVDQDGIDPSLLFENGKAYFLSNGSDDEGKHGVVQCEIDIRTGKKLSPSKCIWQGSGGRYLESPHMYKIGDYYYLTAAEGGTEYGHMVTYARSSNVWGPFEGYAKNPVVTNRNKAPNIIQGIGHADLVQGKDGEWHFVALGFRQIHIWQPFHTLGREVFLLPVSFGGDGWFTCGDGTAEETYAVKGDFEQNVKKKWTFENTDWNIDWCMLRYPDENDYELFDEGAVLHAQIRGDLFLEFVGVAAGGQPEFQRAVREVHALPRVKDAGRVVDAVARLEGLLRDQIFVKVIPDLVEDPLPVDLLLRHVDSFHSIPKNSAICRSVTL